MGLLSSLFPPSVSARAAAEAVRDGERAVLDVRERREWDAGRIAGATHVPLAHLDARARELARERPYVAVCRSGARSARATARLRRDGYDVVNLKGGLRAWERAGLPLEPQNGRVA
jgi:rhodanese-related sulfurtransferase